MSGSRENVNGTANDGAAAEFPMESNDNTTDKNNQLAEKILKRPLWRRVYDCMFWVPPKCRWDPDRPPKFSMALNILFAFAGAFTVANLYYNHPILNILAHDFHVAYEKVAQIPTVAQAGYAAGLFFLCPLGDLLKRRPFVLSLVFFTATMRYVPVFLWKNNLEQCNCIIPYYREEMVTFL